MKRKQILGVILFGIGGAFLFSGYDFACLTGSCFQQGFPPFLVTSGSMSLQVLAILGFVPFSLIAFGIYFVFQPLFPKSIETFEANEEPIELPEENVAVTNRKLAGLSDEELQKELTRMKTIEHVLQARQTDQVSMTSDEMGATLALTEKRISAIEDEIRNRRKNSLAQ